MHDGSQFDLFSNQQTLIGYADSCVLCIRPVGIYFARW